VNCIWISAACKIGKNVWIGKRSDETDAGSSERLRQTVMPRFDVPGPDWDEFQWDHWFDEIISVFMSMFPSKAVSACASLAEYNTGVPIEILSFL
jgi:hypothetical protein